MMKILIVVDMQNDFISGSLGTPEAQAIVPKVKEKIEQYLKDDYYIVYTRDTHFKEDYLSTQEGKLLPVEHCLKDSFGWEIAEEVDYTNLAYNYSSWRIQCLNKTSFSYPFWRTFLGELTPDCKVELIGLCTDICVVSNALVIKSLYPEVPIYVDASCCAGVTPEKHKAALETMKSCQIHVYND